MVHLQSQAKFIATTPHVPPIQCWCEHSRPTRGFGRHIMPAKLRVPNIERGREGGAREISILCERCSNNFARDCRLLHTWVRHWSLNTTSISTVLRILIGEHGPFSPYFNAYLGAPVKARILWDAILNISCRFLLFNSYFRAYNLNYNPGKNSLGPLGHRPPLQLFASEQRAL